MTWGKTLVKSQLESKTRKRGAVTCKAQSYHWGSGWSIYSSGIPRLPTWTLTEAPFTNIQWVLKSNKTAPDRLHPRSTMFLPASGRTPMLQLGRVMAIRSPTSASSLKSLGKAIAIMCRMHTHWFVLILGNPESGGFPKTALHTARCLFLSGKVLSFYVFLNSSGGLRPRAWP